MSELSHQTKKEKKPHKETEQNLKGTFASVLLLGGFILVTWLFIFKIFLDRA